MSSYRLQASSRWVAFLTPIALCPSYRITEKGAELFDFAARNNALVMCHSGHRNSVPEDYIPFADAHPDMNVILAHVRY